VQLRKHEKICRQGDTVTHTIYLVDGTAKLFIEGINSHNIILYLMKPPAYSSSEYKLSLTRKELGEMSAISE